jgi:prophage regulatory protein
MGDRLLTLQGLRDLGIDYSNMHLHRLEASGQFPARIRLSPQRCAWSEQEVQRWLHAKIAARNAEREVLGQPSAQVAA